MRIGVEYFALINHHHFSFKISFRSLVCLVNKQWYAYGVSNTIWRNFYHQYWEGLPLAPSFLECLVESPRQSSEGDSLEDEGEEDEGTSEQNLSSSPKTRLASSRALSSSLYDVKDLRTTFKRKHFLGKP